MQMYVVRHGLTECNKRDVLNGHIDESLIPEGVAQAWEVASLIPESVNHIYTSPLLRARQTAEIINAKRGLPISRHHELKEVNLGLLTGKSWTEIESGEELKEKHRSVQYDYRPEGESVDDVKKRVVSFLRQIQEARTDGEALVVTHGGIIRIFKLLESGLPSLPMKHRIKNASLYIFDLKKILKNSADVVLCPM